MRCNWRRGKIYPKIRSADVAGALPRGFCRPRADSADSRGSDTPRSTVLHGNVVARHIHPAEMRSKTDNSGATCPRVYSRTLSTIHLTLDGLSLVFPFTTRALLLRKIFVGRWGGQPYKTIVARTPEIGSSSTLSISPISVLSAFFPRRTHCGSCSYGHTFAARVSSPEFT